MRAAMAIDWIAREREKPGKVMLCNGHDLLWAYGVDHRVGRVLSFFSSRRNWDSPTPHPQAFVPPPFGSGGRGTLAGERGGGRVPISTRGHTLWFFFIFVLRGADS
jgi:hypothetical protein